MQQDVADGSDKSNGNSNNSNNGKKGGGSGGGGGGTSLRSRSSRNSGGSGNGSGGGGGDDGGDGGGSGGGGDRIAFEHEEIVPFEPWMADPKIAALGRLEGITLEARPGFVSFFVAREKYRLLQVRTWVDTRGGGAPQHRMRASRGCGVRDSSSLLGSFGGESNRRTCSHCDTSRGPRCCDPGGRVRGHVLCDLFGRFLLFLALTAHACTKAMGVARLSFSI